MRTSLTRGLWVALVPVLIGLLPADLAPPAGAAQQESPAQPPLREVPLPSPEMIGPDQPWSGAALPTTPPENPEVGDSWLWWLWTHAPPPPHFAQMRCTVRGKSDRAYVVVEDSQWNVRINQADVDLILERWEHTTIGPYADQGIYEIDSLAFGTPPDELDNDPRVYLCWFNFGIPSDGFFFWFDEYPDGTFPQYHSNECEVLYLNPNNGEDPSGDYMLSVIAHEFEHMIHWKYDDNEDSWVNEGLAELAMWFYGRPDVISVFNTNADNSLILWSGNWADYIKTYLWSLYFFERYGGHEPIYSVVHEPANSIAGYEAVLDAYGYSQSFADVFADWAVANFLDDPTIDDGRFGYVGEDLPAFLVMGTYSTYPVANQPRTVNHWGTDYYRFQNLGDVPALELGFDGIDNTAFAVWGLALHGDGETVVRRMTLDAGTQSGTLAIPGLGDPADQVILVVSGVSSAGGTNYLFNAAVGSAGAPEFAAGDTRSPMDTRIAHLSATPNPCHGEATVHLRWQSGAAPDRASAVVDLYDAQGRCVRSLSARGAPAAGGPVSGLTGHGLAADLRWDGRDAEGRPVAPGLYSLRLRSDSGEAWAASRLLLLR